MRPMTPDGSPVARVISVHVSPPSVDLKRPEPGPPLDIVYSFRKASHSAAYITLGVVRLKAMSIAAVLSSRYRTFFHVRPPSVDLKTPRSAFGTECFPNAATNTISGFDGWIRILEMFSDAAKPTFVQVLPPSLDL